MIIRVSDTGQGIDEDLIPTIFEPFKRVKTKENIRIQGTGLGLAIVKGLVNNMDGDISVTSKPGEGSIFTIIIPVEISDANNVWANTTERTVIKKDIYIPKLEGKRIICVDDTALNLTIIKKLLAPTGLSVDVESNPLKALDRIKETKYDMIFVDHMMPEMQGPELFEKIKESGANVDTDVVIFTGNSGAGVAEKYSKMGFKGYLTKPIMREDLFRTVQSIIEN